MRFDYNLEPGGSLSNRFAAVTDDPLVSIITPYFNSGARFEQTYRCVLNQTFPYYEWIIVNDARTKDADRETLEQLAKLDDRIRVFNTGELSIAQARNLGISQARTEVIVPLDADDLIETSYLEYLYWSLVTHPDASWAYTDNATFGDEEYLWQQVFSGKVMKNENIAIYSAAIRREALEEVGGYTDIGQHFNEDWHFWLKLLAKHRRPVHIEKPLFWYRWSDTGALARFQKDEQLIKNNKRVMAQVAKDVPDEIQAITFSGRRAKEFEKPHTWDWNKTLPFAEEKTRILMLLPHMERGGADKFNLDILKNINRDKYEIGVITTVPAESEWRQQFMQWADDIFELPSFLDMNDWSAFIHYYLQSRKVNILWNISSYYGYYTLPWLRTQFPELAIIDCVHAEGQYWRAGGYPRVSAAVDSVIDKTFVTNEFTRNIMVEKYGKEWSKTQVIYTGIDEIEFNPAVVECEGIKEKYNIQEDRPTVLFLCRIAPEKRPFLMLEVAREVKKRLPEVCFLVVGDGPQMSEFKGKVHDYGLTNHVYIAGAQADIRPYYKVSDLFLLTSIKEGLSLTTIESMLMGKPVISADVGSQYELVTQDTGILVSCRQSESEDFDRRTFPREEILDYTNAICELITNADRRSNMGQACREKVLNGFTLSTLIETMEKAFVAFVRPDAIRQRCGTSESLRVVERLCEEFLTVYVEYENSQVYFRGTHLFLSYIRDLVTFRRSIFSILRDIQSRTDKPIVKLLFKKIKANLLMR
ncbi:glycosyltransferase [Alicyclobacillus mengziensis]|uniref:Glycosyltransferase n=1 Tax=Alicyclobacillus mengziensis TaxID=2931921 RepID=A0A9X7VZQ9_9BACL|nr:glycosyltransferase [Alicyclobacillus mengziensis]QSO47532.1 glycosyltransferase [Alicyclobacillus mengziensis]